MSTEIALALNSDKGFEEAIRKSLMSRGVTADWATIWISNALSAVRALTQPCTADSIRTALLRAGRHGLTPGLRNECWLIPYKGQCTFQMGFGGVVKLLVEHKVVRHVQAVAIFEKDSVIIDYGQLPESQVRHSPFMGKDRGPVVGAWCRFMLPDGSLTSMTYIGPEDIELSRKHSKQPNSLMWSDYPHEAAKRTVIMKAAKLLPLVPDELNDQEDVVIDADPPPAPSVEVTTQSKKPLAPARLGKVLSANKAAMTPEPAPAPEEEPHPQDDDMPPIQDEAPADADAVMPPVEGRDIKESGPEYSDAHEACIDAVQTEFRREIKNREAAIALLDHRAKRNYSKGFFSMPPAEAEKLRQDISKNRMMIMHGILYEGKKYDPATQG